MILTLKGSIVEAKLSKGGRSMFQITLVAARVNAGLKQEVAAQKIGVTAKTLRNYERGVTMIPSQLLRKAAELYEIPSDYIRLPAIDDGEHDEEEFLSHPTTF